MCVESFVGEGGGRFAREREKIFRVPRPLFPSWVIHTHMSIGMWLTQLDNGRAYRRCRICIEPHHFHLLDVTFPPTGFCVSPLNLGKRPLSTLQRVPLEDESDAQELVTDQSGSNQRNERGVTVFTVF